MSKLRGWLSNEAGNVAIIFAVTLPIVIGGAGFGVETSFWYFKDLSTQSAADAAAFAGTAEKLAGSNLAAITSAATNSAVANGFQLDSGTIEVFSPPITGPNTAKKAVEVVLHQSLPRFFTAMFTQAPLVVQARAVAKYETVSKACVLALNTSASKAALFSGSSDVTLTGCAVMSNSLATDAIKVQGSAHVTVDCLLSAGGVDLAGGSTSTTCGAPITQTEPAADPFADVPTPPTTTPCKDAKATLLQPGTYCNGLSLKGTVALSPGVYVIDGGNFSVNANAIVSGSGVTIYVTCGSQVSMNGTATVQLSAPTTGSYSGMLFYGDRTCPTGSNTFNGTANSLLTGALYFAQQDVQYLGNFSGNGGCSQVVAGTITWSGHTSIKQDCTSLGMRDIPATQLVQLIE